MFIFSRFCLVYTEREEKKTLDTNSRRSFDSLSGQKMETVKDFIALMEDSFFHPPERSYSYYGQ